MLVSKVLTGNTPATINLSDFTPSGAAQVWQLTSANTINQLSNIALNANSLSLSLPPQSITLLVIPSLGGISACGAAIRETDGANLVLANMVVTAVFSAEGVIYVEQSDRSAGIRVVCSQTNLAVGDRVNVAGTVGTRHVGGIAEDRQLVSSAVVRVSGGAALTPLAMGNQTVGATAGVGLTVIGLLAKVFGRVSQVVGNDIYVDDGSGIIDPSGDTGILVQCAAKPGVSIGDFVSATGIVEGDVPSGAIASRGCIQLRQVSDLDLIVRAL
jgi:hypothetical protein